MLKMFCAQPIKRNTYFFQYVLTLFIATFLIGWNHASPNSDNNPVLGFSSASQDTLIIEEKYTEEIKDLFNNPKIKRALTYIEESDEQAVADQINLTEIPSPPFGEENRSKKFAEMLQEYGADSVWIDSIGNAIGLKKGTEREKVLAISGHLDTVFPAKTDVTMHIAGDTLKAPGISDDGRGLTTVLSLLRTAEENGIRFKSDVLFIGNVGEEGLGDLRGMKHLFRDGGPQIDAFISVDGTSRTAVTNGGLGSHRYRVTFKGPGGHSWGTFGLVNPHHAAARAITHFVEQAEEYTKTGAKTSYNIGRTGGGTSVNSIPFESWFEVDMRSLSPERLDEIDEILQQSIQKGLKEQNELRRFGPELTVDIDMIGNRPSGHTASENPVVQKALAATKAFGADPSLRTSSTDSNIPISKGIPAFTIGGGGTGSGAHSLNEWYLNKEGYLGIQRAFLIITSIAELDEDQSE